MFDLVHKVYGKDYDGNDLGVVSYCVHRTDEKFYVPIDPTNRHYQEIMRQVESGELVIQEAE